MADQNFTPIMVQQFLFSPELWWIVWAVLTGVVIVFSVIFIFHWRIYGLRRHPAVIAEIVYLAGAAFLLLAAAGAIITLSL